MTCKRILVVDDQWDNLECLQELLQPEFEVVAACGGEAALETLADEHFDGLMLDLQMPDVDGFEVMEYVHRRLPDLPVMLASGAANLPKIASEIGATDFIGKPYLANALYSKLRKLVA
jgi:CheY-like chemotaxis protein